MPAPTPSTFTTFARLGAVILPTTPCMITPAGTHGYVPPPPASVAAYAGNNCNLVCWPVTPGATSYNILRSTTSGSGYASITNGVIGPVCGSGSNNARLFGFHRRQRLRPITTWCDRSIPPAAAPIRRKVLARPLRQSVHERARRARRTCRQQFRPPKCDAELDPSSGANFYSVWRSTLVNTGGGSSNTLSTIILE